MRTHTLAGTQELGMRKCTIHLLISRTNSAQHTDESKKLTANVNANTSVCENGGNEELKHKSKL